MNVLIVIPTFNEGANIEHLICTLFNIDQDYHLLIVDDNSPDGTGEKVATLQEKYKNLHLARRPGKAGLGTAYCYGFKWALEKNYDRIVQMDADLSHNPEDVPDLLKLLDDHDLVIGSRYCDGISVVRWPLRRLIISYGANLYSRIVTGVKINDATGGFKAWRREALGKVDLDSIRSQGYSFQIEMNYRATKLNFRIIEHPIIFIDRTIGQSKMSRAVMIEAFYRVWILRFSRRFKAHGNK